MAMVLDAVAVAVAVAEAAAAAAGGGVVVVVAGVVVVVVKRRGYLAPYLHTAREVLYIQSRHHVWAA